MCLLLQAAVSPGPDARIAWDRWLDAVVFEHLEPGATELLSLVSRNVPDLGTEDSIERRVHGVHRRTWARNGMIWARASALVDEIAATIGPPVLVGPAAMIPIYGNDWGARPLDWVELALPPSAARATHDLLASAGWLVEPVSPSLVARTDAGLVARWQARHADGGRTTLRWHVLRRVPARVVDEQFLGASQPVTVGSSALRVLHPADAMIERLWHASREDPGWIADAVQLGRQLAAETAVLVSGGALARFATRTDRLGIGRRLTERLALARAVVPDPGLTLAIDALATGHPSSVSALWALADSAGGKARPLAGHCAGQGVRAGVVSLLRAQVTARRLRSRGWLSARRT